MFNWRFWKRSSAKSSVTGNGDPIGNGPPRGLDAQDEEVVGAVPDPFVTDAAVQLPDQDRFRRWPFAQRVAHTIATRQDPASLVIGIYGEWGDGKTSVLNLIKYELDRTDRVVCFRYNPWRYPSEEVLLKEFFTALAGAVRHSVERRHERLAERLGSAAGMLPPIKVSTSPGDPHAPTIEVNPGEWLSTLTRQFSTVQLDEYRERMDAVLRETSTRVVVLMDDIDRLDKEEIHAVFRLVKLSADFANTVYVLAFDPEVVAEAIGERYASNPSDAGHSFLEKIVQVPLQLPAADPSTLRQYCFEHVDRALGGAGIELSQEQVNEFVSQFTGSLELRLRTPRMASRYGNILAFSLPILIGEVHPVDLMLVEGIRLFYPTMYHAIREHPDAFLHGNSSEKRTAQAKQIITGGLVGLTDAEGVAVTSLVSHLFPRVQGVFGNMMYGPDWDATWARAQRIASDRYFPRYFSYAVPEADVADRTLDEFLRQAGESEPALLSETLALMLDARNAEAVVERLRARAKALSPSAATRLALAIAPLGARFPDPDTLFDFRTPAAQAAYLMRDLTLRVRNAGERLELAEAIANQAHPLGFATRYVRSLRVPEQEDSGTKAVEADCSEEEKKHLLGILARRVQDHAAEQPLYRMGKEGRTLLLLWAYAGDRQESDAYIREAVAREPGVALEVLSCFVGTSWGMETGLPSISDFERDEYNVLARVVDPGALYRALGKIDGLDLHADQYPDDSEEQPQTRIARQFAFVHRKVQADDQETNRSTSDQPD
jgi:hypothetical protein